MLKGYLRGSGRRVVPHSLEQCEGLEFDVTPPDDDDDDDGEACGGGQLVLLLFPIYFKSLQNRPAATAVILEDLLAGKMDWLFYYYYDDWDGREGRGKRRWWWR